MTHDSSDFKAPMDSSESFESLARQLCNLFPDAGNISAWKEAIYSAQHEYAIHEPQLADHQLFVASRWLKLAQAKLLDVKMNPVRGMIVRELSPDEPVKAERQSNVVRRHIEKILFMELKELKSESNLLYSYFSTLFLMPHHILLPTILMTSKMS